MPQAINPTNPAPATPSTPAPVPPAEAPQPPDGAAAPGGQEDLGELAGLDVSQFIDSPDEAEPEPPPAEGEGEAGPEGTEPTPPVEEKPAEGSETDTAPATEETAVAPEPQPAEESPTAEQLEAHRQAVADFQKWEASFGQLLKDVRANKPPEDYDQAIGVLLQGIEYMAANQRHLAQQLAGYQQQSGQERFWSEFARANPEVGLDAGRKLWQQALTEAQRDYGRAGAEAVRAVASERFNAKIAAAKAAKKPPAATPAGTPTPPPAPSRPAAKPPVKAPPVRLGGTARTAPPPAGDDDGSGRFDRDFGKSVLDTFG